MIETKLTERQRREREYYDTYVQLTSSQEVTFDPVLGVQKRSWNSYWYVSELVLENFHSPQQRLLDFGCGNGYFGMQYAKVGYDTYGFDISANNVDHASKLARACGFEQRTHFQVGAAEKLDYPDEFFDIIVGVDILHHIEINQAMDECKRVLKPGGIAIFHEPIRVPAFDSLRESKLGVWLVPNTASFGAHITEDEKKLTNRDLDIIRRFDPNMEIQPFLLLSRFEKFWRSQQENLEKLDCRLFKLLPFLGKFGGRLVITLRKPND